MILLCTYDWLLVKNLIDINVHREAHLFSLPNDCLWYDKLWGASQRVVTLFKLFHLASMTCCSFVSLDIDNCLSCCFPPAIKCIKITNRPPILDIQTKLWLLWPLSPGEPAYFSPIHGQVGHFLSNTGWPPCSICHAWAACWSRAVTSVIAMRLHMICILPKTLGHLTPTCHDAKKKTTYNMFINNG